MKTKEKIYKIKAITLKTIRTNPIVMEIFCDGEANTPGWECPELIPLIYSVPPANGIYEFDFIAVPSEGVVPQVITEIKAKYIRLNFPDSLEGIKIYSSSNSLIQNR